MNTQQQMIDVLNDLDRLIKQHENGCPYISERVYLAMCSQADYLAGQIRLLEGVANKPEKQTVYVLSIAGHNNLAFFKRENAEKAKMKLDNEDEFYAEIEELVIDKYIDDGQKA